MSPRRHRRLCLILGLFALAIDTAPALASEGITSFHTTLIETNSPLGEVAAAGIVSGAPSGESFQIETTEGATYTVETKPSTTYRYAHPVAGEAADPPTLASVLPGEFVGVSGELSGQTVSSTDRRHLHPPGRRPPRPLHLLRPRPARRTRSRPERHLQRPHRRLRQPPRRHPVRPRRLRPRPLSSQRPGRPDHPARQRLRQLQLPARHRPDLLDRTPRRRNRPLCVPRPRPRHPDRDPGPGPHHHRLRPALHGQRHHPAHPACLRPPHLLGLPGGPKPRSPALPQRRTGPPDRLPRRRRHRLQPHPDPLLGSPISRWSTTRPPARAKL